MSINRLKEIYDLIPETDIFADVGCDHGLLCKMVFDGNKAKRILAIDISEACLNKAKALLNDNAEYYLGDGLAPLGNIVPNVTVISGMGGNTVLHIISDKILPMVIVSPHNDAYKVRDRLTGIGYKIVEDKVIYDYKFYDLIKFEPGFQRLTELQKIFGAFFYKGEETFRQRLLIYKEKIKSYKQTEENIKRMNFITEAEKCLK